MARGKEAAAAATRRLEAAHDHIDRITSELVDAKIRAKEAEKRAASLEGADKLVATASAKHDEMLMDALVALQDWKRIAKEDGRRRMAAMRELIWELTHDLGIEGDLPLLDRWELIGKRYPATHIALMAGQLDMTVNPDILYPWGMNDAQKRLKGENLRRFQRICGMRASIEVVPGRNAADVWNDLLDAKQLGLTLEETLATAPGSD